MTRYGQGDLDAILNYPDDPDPVAAELARQIQAAGFANVQADPGGALCVIAYLFDEDARKFLQDLQRRKARDDDHPVTRALADEVMEIVNRYRPGSSSADQMAREIRAVAGDSIKAAALAERERITTLFGDWIEILMSEPNSHPPAAWRTAFAELIAIGD